MAQLGKKLLMASLILVAGCSDNSEQEVRDLVNSFYQTQQSSHPNGALSLQELIGFRHFLSVPLFELLTNVSVAAEARQAQNDDDLPPLVDGDLFTSHPKGASSYRLLLCQIDENNANCSTELTYLDAQMATPYKSIDRIVLIRDGRGWVINNIVYGAAANSGMHQGDLRQTLHAILKH